MAHSTHARAIILKTYNVGEADRFCIVFTEEFGKIAVRARAVRKMNSKLGASMLGGHFVALQIHESTTGFIAQEAQTLYTPALSSNATFTLLQPVLEICLTLLPEHAPVVDVFGYLEKLWSETEITNTKVIGCLLQVIDALGYLPSIHHASIQERCSADELQMLHACIAGNWHTIEQMEPVFAKRLAQWIQNIVTREADKPLVSLVC
jgi:recombinational DNA repair protein (RecF pathway)